MRMGKIGFSSHHIFGPEFAVSSGDGCGFVESGPDACGCGASLSTIKARVRVTGSYQNSSSSSRKKQTQGVQWQGEI